jgi:hypothetical protein
VTSNDEPWWPVRRLKLLPWQWAREQRTLFTRPMHAGLAAGRFPVLTHDSRHFQTATVVIPGKKKKSTNRLYCQLGQWFITALKFTVFLDWRRVLRYRYQWFGLKRYLHLQVTRATSVPKTKAAGNYALLVPIYQTTYDHIPNDLNSNLRSLHTTSKLGWASTAVWALTACWTQLQGGGGGITLKDVT